MGEKGEEERGRRVRRYQAASTPLPFPPNSWRTEARKGWQGRRRRRVHNLQQGNGRRTEGEEGKEGRKRQRPRSSSQRQSFWVLKSHAAAANILQTGANSLSGFQSALYKHPSILPIFPSHPSRRPRKRNRAPFSSLI